MRDYMSYKIQGVLNQIEDLNRQERIAREARGAENRSKRDEAERKARTIREALLRNLPPAAVYKFLGVTGSTNAAVNFRTLWQERNLKVDCLQEMAKGWEKGSDYYRQAFETPRIDLAVLLVYSFVVQFTFTLAQPYISRDEQDFYIIDNPVRKDKVFGLPYVASTSWKGSLRAALWHLERGAGNGTVKDDALTRLFGNEKGEQKQEKFHAGYLFFFPTFFTEKSLEIINPQDRKLRVGSLPIPFESVPAGARGTFTLLYVPFDGIGETTENTRKQVGEDLVIVMKGLQAMFYTYGFGAKTHSGFGLVKEMVQRALIEVHATGVQRISEASINFEQLIGAVEKLAHEVMG